MNFFKRSGQYLIKVNDLEVLFKQVASVVINVFVGQKLKKKSTKILCIF